MAYLLGNNCTETYWNRTTTVKIIVVELERYTFVHAWHSGAEAQ